MIYGLTVLKAIMMWAAILLSYYSLPCNWEDSFPERGSPNARANHPVNTFLNECLYTSKKGRAAISPPHSRALCPVHQNLLSPSKISLPEFHLRQGQYSLFIKMARPLISAYPADPDLRLM